MKENVCHHADREANHSQSYQMHIALPLPRFQSEGLKNGQRHHYKRGTDDPCRNGFYTFLFHTVGKGTKKRTKNQTIPHIFAI